MMRAIPKIMLPTTKQEIVRITYPEMVSRYGKTASYALLQTMERLAKIRNDILGFDEDDRLQNALTALDHVNFADKAANNN